MAESLSCSLANNCNSSCGASSIQPDVREFVPLTSCVKEIGSHLKQVKVARRSVPSEVDLILARAGLFGEKGTHMTICPKHRLALGLFWRPTRKCTHPLHGRKKGRPERGASLQMSKEIMANWNVLVPVGSGICKKCRTEHSVFTLEKKSEEPQENSGENIHNQFVEPVPFAECTEISNQVPLEPILFQKGATPLVETSESDAQVLSSTSQESVVAVETSQEWEATPQVQHKLVYLNNFIRHTSGGSVSPVRSQLQSDLQKCSTRTSRYYKRKALQVVDTVLDAIAPGQSTQLMQHLVVKYTKGTAEGDGSEKTLLSRLIKLYEEAGSWYTKQQILSTFVSCHSKTELLELIPGLTKWRIDEARKHATVTGPGRAVEMQPIYRCRMDPVKVDHFIDFISSPSFLQDVAYGTKTIKLSNGEKLEIPNVVRTVVASRLIKLYCSYCSEVGVEALHRSTLFNILQVCAASQKKSLSCLDSTTADGMSAFSSLEAVADSLRTFGECTPYFLGAVSRVKKTMVKCHKNLPQNRQVRVLTKCYFVTDKGLNEERTGDIKNRLKSSKTYMKSDFKVHVSTDSPCADHCRVFALSTAEPEFRGGCLHEHNLACDRCEGLKSVVLELDLFISSTLNQTSSTDSRKDQLEEIQHELHNTVPMVEDWKAHILRSVHQDSAKRAVLDNLCSNQVLVVMDWAMKFLPSSFRETQKDWFGKKGKSWHVSVAVTKGSTGELESRSYVHAFDQCTQNWYAVLSVMEHTLKTVRLTKPDVTQAFFRSDNAGCYHCGFLILSLPSLGKRTGVEVVRYDFSEPQAGKDVCDRRIAAMKSHMRRFINEGHNVQTAQDMKNALDSYGGVKGCYVAVAEVNEACQTMTKHSMVGVQAFNNFAFDADGVRVWKAYNVGPGKFYTNAQLMKMGPAQGPTKMNIVQDFVNPVQEVGTLLNPRKQLKTSTREDNPATTSEQQEDVLDDEDPVTDREEEMVFSCPEEGCVKKYVSFSNLQKHLDVGKHFLKLERECGYDEIKRKWAETCGTVSSSGYVQIEHHQTLRPSSDSGEQSAIDTSHPSADEGWAVKKTRKSTRFSETVKGFLKDVFLEGQDTGKKANPADISSKMKNLRSESSGRKVFGRDEWLTTQQVASYFSRLAALNKSGRLPVGTVQADVPSEEDDPDLRHERDEMACQAMREEIRRQIEL